jgi:hypothetical protein
MHELDTRQPRLRRRLVIASLTVVLVAVLSPGLAQADRISLGAGQQPDVAIDSSGTAYIAWNSTDGNTLYFCRLPESASSCSPTTLPVRDYASARPAVFVNGSTVQVLTNRCCSAGSQTELFTSSDGGVTFGSPVVIGNLNPSGDAVYGPGNGISMITSALINSYYQFAPTDGSAAPSTPVPLSSQYTYHGVIGIASAKPVVVFDDLANLAWTTTNGGDPNQGASWQSAQQIAAGHDPHLANGPKGLLLVSTNSAGNLELRSFTGSGWSDPAVVGSLQGLTSAVVDAFAQGPTGGLAIVFKAGSGNPTDLDFTGSTDAAKWTDPQVLASDSQIANLRVAEAPNDGTGLAAWDNGSQVSVARHPVPTAPPPPTPPRAAFTYRTVGPLCAPKTGAKTVYFDAGASTPGSAPIVSYEWHFFDAPGMDQTLASSGYTGTPFSNYDTTTGPTAAFAYKYTDVSVPYYGGQIIADFAIFGTSVSLYVTNADGLRSRAYQLLPFRDPLIDLFGPPPAPASCFGASDFTGPLTITRASVNLLADSTVAVPFACKRVVLCGGLVTLSTIGGPGGTTASVASVAGGRSAGVVVGRTRFALARGHDQTIRITLNRRGRALARHGHLRKLRVTVTTVHLGRRGKPKTVSRVVRVRRARRR